MKVLLTGAAGKLGGEACKALVLAGHEVRATDRSARRDLPVGLEVVNLLDREACYGLVEGVDAVVHLGNHPHVNSADAQRVFAENCAMNINIFQAALESGVRKIVYASSIQVINGDRRWDEENHIAPSMLPYLPIDGDTPANPANAYSLSKRAGELVLESLAKFHGLSCVAVRFPLIASEKWIQRSKEHRKDRPFRSLLDEGFSMVFQQDAADLLVAIVAADLPGFRIYLPSIAKPTIDEPIPQIIAKYFTGVPLRRPAAEMTSLVDISRIERETGWSPRHGASA